MQSFNEIININDLIFEVSGTYYPEENYTDFELDDINDTIPYEINFETAVLTITTDEGTFTLDATPILDALECWDKLEGELISQLPINEDY